MLDGCCRHMQQSVNLEHNKPEARATCGFLEGKDSKEKCYLWTRGGGLKSGPDPSPHLDLNIFSSHFKNIEKNRSLRA